MSDITKRTNGISVRPLAVSKSHVKKDAHRVSPAMSNCIPSSRIAKCKIGTYRSKYKSQNSNVLKSKDTGKRCVGDVVPIPIVPIPMNNIVTFEQKKQYLNDNDKVRRQSLKNEVENNNVGAECLVDVELESRLNLLTCRLNIAENEKVAVRVESERQRKWYVESIADRDSAYSALQSTYCALQSTVINLQNKSDKRELELSEDSPLDYVEEDSLAQAANDSKNVPGLMGCAECSRKEDILQLIETELHRKNEEQVRLKASLYKIEGEKEMISTQHEVVRVQHEVVTGQYEVVTGQYEVVTGQYEVVVEQLRVTECDLKSCQGLLQVEVDRGSKLDTIVEEEVERRNEQDRIVVELREQLVESERKFSEEKQRRIEMEKEIEKMRDTEGKLKGEKEKEKLKKSAREKESEMEIETEKKRGIEKEYKELQERIKMKERKKEREKEKEDVEEEKRRREELDQWCQIKNDNLATISVLQGTGSLISMR